MRRFMTCRSFWILALAANACDGRFDFDPWDGPTALDGATSGDRVATPPTRGVCATDANCPASLHCETGSGECVGCVDDEHCPTDRPRCEYALHRCVECGSASDCGTNGICEKSTHRCLVSCAQGREGACGPVGDESVECEEGRAICVHCDRERPCSSSDQGLICDSAVGLCVQCVSDADCPSTASRCDRTRGKCLPCLHAADCPAEAPWCDSETGACMPDG